jgi:hypothetical protein
MECYVRKSIFSSCSAPQQAFWDCYRRERVGRERQAAPGAYADAGTCAATTQGVDKTRIKAMLETKL